MIKKIIFIIIFPLIFYFSVSAMRVKGSSDQFFELTEQEAALARQCTSINNDIEFYGNQEVLNLSHIALPRVTKENFLKTISCIGNKKRIQELPLNELVDSFWMADMLAAPPDVLREMAERINAAKNYVTLSDNYKILKLTIKHILSLEPLTEDQLKNSLVIAYADNEQTQPQCALMLQEKGIKNVHGIHNLVPPYKPSVAEQSSNTLVTIPLRVTSFLTKYWRQDQLLYKNISREFDRSWLVHIDLSNNGIERFNLKKIITAYPRLRSLNLSNNALKVLRAKMFKGMPKIFYLDLSYNPIEHMDDEAVAALLDISRNSCFLRSAIFVIDLRSNLPNKPVYKKLECLQKEPYTVTSCATLFAKNITMLMLLVTGIYGYFTDNLCYDNDQAGCIAFGTIYPCLLTAVGVWNLCGTRDAYYRLTNKQHILLKN